MSLTQINLNQTTISIKNVEKLFAEMYFENNDNTISFDMVKQKFQDLNIKVRENNLCNLYLLVSDNLENYTPLELECNGLILEKETNKIVCMCQNKFTQINNDTTFEIENEFKAEYCEDGTVIRVYNYGNTWFTATTKCIDAKNSYWSSEKTFDTMFWETFGKNVDSLDKNFTYSFILINTENRIVVNHQQNSLIYINRISNLTKEEDFINTFTFPSTLELNVPIINFYNLDDYTLDTKRGIIIKVKEENEWKIFQYDFNSYTLIKEVRGNVPMIRMRYLELLNNPEKLLLLEQNYPENLMVFSMIKHCMNNLYKQIHNLYYQSHIKHSVTVTEDNKFYRCLKQLHGIHKKQGVIITLEEVTKKINSLDKNIIKKLLGWVC